MSMERRMKNDSRVTQIVPEVNLAAPEQAAIGPLPAYPGPSIRIEASKAWPSLKLRELCSHGELIYFLVWRDIKVRYKQTVLGAGWALLQPLFTMLLFSIFFGRLAKIPSEGIPYPLFAFTALVPWTYFANTFVQSSNSLVSNSTLIKRVYFPRLIIPVAKVLSGLVEFGLSSILLLAMTLYYGYHPSLRVLGLPALLLLAMITSLGSSLWLSALNVYMRDVEQIVPFLVQIWMYATPIAYPTSLVPAKWRTLYAINPMVGVAEGFRWALCGTNTVSISTFVVSSAIALVLLVSGAYWFRRLERTFADVL